MKQSKQIKLAQLQPTIEIKGKDHPRIPYGKESEDWGASKQPCHNCTVIKGQLHVPSCDVERCPICGGQLISCNC